MTTKDISKLHSEKREYLISLYLDYISIYLNTLIFVKNSKNERDQLTNFFNDYFKYHKLENKVLKYLKIKCRNENNNELCDEILEELNKIFFNTYNYNEWILKGYTDMIETNQTYRAYIPPKEFKILDENLKDEYIKKLSKIL